MVYTMLAVVAVVIGQRRASRRKKAYIAAERAREDGLQGVWEEEFLREMRGPRSSSESSWKGGVGQLGDQGVTSRSADEEERWNPEPGAGGPKT